MKVAVESVSSKNSQRIDFFHVYLNSTIIPHFSGLAFRTHFYSDVIFCIYVTRGMNKKEHKE